MGERNWSGEGNAPKPLARCWGNGKTLSTQGTKAGESCTSACEAGPAGKGGGVPGCGFYLCFVSSRNWRVFYGEHFFHSVKKVCVCAHPALSDHWRSLPSEGPGRWEWPVSAPFQTSQQSSSAEGRPWWQPFSSVLPAAASSSCPSLLPAGTGPERVCLVLATQSPVFPMRQWTCGRQGQDGHAATAVLPAPARRSTQPPGTA